MNDKYYEMHDLLMTLCSRHRIRLIPGRVAYADFERETLLRAEKTYYIFSDDWDILNRSLKDNLGKTYVLSESSDKNEFKKMKLARTDIFAGTMEGVFRHSKGTYHPSFIICEIKAEEDGYTAGIKSDIRHIPTNTMESLQEKTCFDWTLHIPAGVETFFTCVYGSSNVMGGKVKEYELFYEDVNVEAFFAEAKNRKLLTSKKKRRFKAFETWKKNIERPAARAYYAYQKELLALTLPEEE